MSEYLRHDVADLQGTLSATGTVAPLVTNRDGILGFDCRHFASIFLQISGTFTASLQVQFSNDDGATWTAAPAAQLANAYTTLTTMSATGGYVIPIMGKLVRVQCTAYTSGTVSIKGLITTNAPTFPTNATSSVNLTPSVAIGASTWSHIVSAASTNSTFVKASNGVINNIVVSNNGAGVAYFKLYDKASAPTVGTDTPILTVLIPINGTVVIPGGTFGSRCATGIGYGITGGAAVADVTAVAAAQVVGTINYT